MSGNKKITVNELFSGIGAQRKALEKISVRHEIIGISEIDKYAIKSYTAMFGETFNYGDITEIKRLNYADLWTYSFPCTDISVAGKQEGITPNTRSGLLYEVRRLLDIADKEGLLPKYLLLENVKNLVGKKFKNKFIDWLKYLDNLGYNTYWQVLNAKDYGVPQNRERVYGISIRKDIDKQKFKFPEKEVLNKRLVDVLEKEVDESFYLKQKTLEYFIKNSFNNEQKGNGFRFKPHNPKNAEFAFSITTKAGSRMDDNYLIVASRGRNPLNPSDRSKGANFKQRLEANTKGISNTITTVQKDNLVLENKIIQVGNIVESGNWNNPQRGRIYSSEGISPTLNTMQGGGSEPKVIIDDTTGFGETRIYNDYSPTLRANRSGLKVGENIRIRKLTPLECWRLMGFDDADVQNAKNAGVSNTQLYKQAGNSIVVNVLEKIFYNLFQ